MVANLVAKSNLLDSTAIVSLRVWIHSYREIRDPDRGVVHLAGMLNSPNTRELTC